MHEDWDPRASIAHPLLFECDRQGRVIWMSLYARKVVGDVPLHAAIADYLRGGARFRAWAALVLPETLLFAVQMEDSPATELLPVGDKLLGRYFRLEKTERQLAARMRRGQAGRGATALCQIERERQRLGRELHTGVGQMIAAIRLQLDAIATQVQDPGDAARDALERMNRLSQEALQEIRGISHRLYPPEWQRLSLDDALRQLWEAAGTPQIFEAAMRIEPLPRAPEHEIKVLLYRATQEALSNIARHSLASRVKMTLETLNDRIVLTIWDNGRGFAAASAAANSGLGLRSIRDAAAEAGARFEVESAPGSTSLKIWAPFEAR